MDNRMRNHTTHLGLAALLLVVSVAGWASMMPGQLTVKPTVTINQAVGQRDPTNTAPIHFTVIFSKTVKDFTASDVTLTASTAPGTLIKTVTGKGTKYDVAVTGMTGPGFVIATLAAGVAHDTVGNASKASTSTDNSVYYGVSDVIPPTVTINHIGQADPTSTVPIRFTVVFSEVVTDFAAGDVTLSGTAPGTLVGTVTGTGTTYYVYVNGMTGPGLVTANLAAGVAHDAAGIASTASNSDTVEYLLPDVTPPDVTINHIGQADPTNTAPIRFTVVFSEVVTDFAAGDVTLSGTAPGTLVGTVTGTGTTYYVYVNGMTGSGTVIANLAAGVAHDAAGNASTASTTGSTDSTDNQVTYDVTLPTVTIKQHVEQDDPTSTLPIRFTVVFSEVVTGFAAGDVTLSGTASGAYVSGVTGTGTTTYDVYVNGITGPGTVTARLVAGVAQDAVGNLNEASTTGLPPYDDNTVTYIYYVDPFVPLGTAATFGAFGSFAGMTNTGVYTIIYGDIGTTAACAEVTGFHDSTGDVYTETPLNYGTVTGRIYAYPPPTVIPPVGNHGGNAFTKVMADAALADSQIAYNYLKALPITDPDPTASQAIAGDLGGLTVAPGIYKAAGESFCIMPGETLTLDALGDPNAVWVFQMGTSLTVGTAGFGGTPAKVVFKDNVGQPKNVYWQVGTGAYINTGAVMVGTIIAGTTVTFSTADQTIMTTLDGRALALTESVTMVNTIIRVPSP